MVDSVTGWQPASARSRLDHSPSTLSNAPATPATASYAVSGNAERSNIGSGDATLQTHAHRSPPYDSARAATVVPPDDALSRALSEGMALKRMAEQARKHTAAALMPLPLPIPANLRLKKNWRDAVMAGLLLSDRITPCRDAYSSATRSASGEPAMVRGKRAHAEADAAQPAPRLPPTTPGPRMIGTGETGERSPGTRSTPPAATSGASSAGSDVLSNHRLIDATLASIEDAFLSEFPAQDRDREMIDSIFDHVAMNKWKGANNEPKDDAGAWIQLHIEILDYADWELYRRGRTASDDRRIDVLTSVRTFSFSELRKKLGAGTVQKKLEDIFSTKKLICFDFILEKVVYMLSGGDPVQISRNINTHIVRIEKSLTRLGLDFAEDIDFRISKNEISRLVRQLNDPKHLSGELDSPERLRAWIADKGAAWILQLENVTIQFWLGVSNLALQRLLSEFNATVERYAWATGAADPAARRPGAVTAEAAIYSSAALHDPDSTDAMADSLADVHSVRLRLLGQIALDQTSSLYRPILNLPAYIDDSIRAGIANYTATTGKYKRFSPSTSIRLELVPEERTAHGLLLMRPRERIGRYYTVKQIVTRSYLHDVERLRDPHGRTYRVMKRYAEDLLAHLERINLARKAHGEIKKYRNDPKIISGFRSLLAGLVMTRCLQYLDTAYDLATVYAIEAFLRGEAQAETLSFHNVAVSGVFMIRTGTQSAILFSMHDNAFFLAGSAQNERRPESASGKDEAMTRFDTSQEFKDWILSKLPLHASIKYRDDPDAFEPAANALGHLLGQPARVQPFQTFPTSDSEELITTLYAIEMDRCASDVDTLLGRKKTLIDWLKDTGSNVFKAMTMPLSMIKPAPSLGSLAASVFNFAMTSDPKDFKLGFSALTSLRSEHPDRAEAYYSDALISGILGLLFNGGDGVLSQLTAISHRISLRSVEGADILRRRPMRVANIGQALTLFRQIRNEIPYLSQNIGLRIPLFKAGLSTTQDAPQAGAVLADGQLASKLGKTKAGKAASSSAPTPGVSRRFASKYMRAVHGSSPVLSTRKISVAGKVRVVDEIIRNHIDGSIWSTFRIDMGKYYLYTLRPKDTLIYLDHKRLTFSAHGSYIEQEGMAVNKLVPVPAGTVVSYLTPAGLALGDPGLSETMTFNEVVPYVVATSQSAAVSAEAINRFNTPFDMLGHDLQERTVKFRDQYFRNFPYENEAEINRALVKNLVYNKGTEKLSDLGVVKPGQLMTLSELLKNEAGHNDVLISACRVFAMNGTNTINALEPDLKEKLFCVLSRNFEAAANGSVNKVKNVVGTPQLPRKTFDDILMVHDEVADKLRCKPHSPRLSVNERRYTAYELLRTYVVAQNQNRGRQPPTHPAIAGPSRPHR